MMIYVHSLKTHCPKEKLLNIKNVRQEKRIFMDKLSLLQDWLNKNSYTIYNSFKHKLPDVNEKNFKYYVLKELDSFETFSFKNFSKNSMVYEGIKSGQILIFYYYLSLLMSL